MKPVSERDDRELAALVRARLQARQPRRLPERFQPPAPRRHRVRWAALTAAAAIVLGLAAAEAVRPDLGSSVRSGVLDRLPGAHAGSPALATPRGGGSPVRPSGTRQSPGAGGAGATGAGSATSPGSSPVPSGGSSPAPLTSLPPLPLPTPSVPLPVPTPSLPPLP